MDENPFIRFLDFQEPEIQYLGPLHQSSFLTLTMKTHFIAHFQCKCSFPTASQHPQKVHPLDFLQLKSITYKISIKSDLKFNNGRKSKISNVFAKLD